MREGSKPVPVRLEFEKRVLDNGLDLVLHEDRRLPVVHVNLWYHVGSKNEKPGKTGFAHLFEHMMFAGSKHVRGEYITLMERAGASVSRGGVNGTTSFDRTNYFETVPAGALELVLWAESDRMGFLLDGLTQENLDNQRDVVKNERRQSMDNVPYGRAMELICQNLFPPGHPYSWHIIGSMEDLERASLEDVKEFFRTFYTPNNCTLVVAGRFDRDEVIGLVERYFGSLPPGPPLDRPKRNLARLDAERRLVVVDRVPQRRLYLAWPSVPYFEPGDAALDLLGAVLATGKNSRLYKRLVYDDRIASDVSAFQYSLEIAGVFGIVATARPDVSLEPIERAIDEEIARIAAGGPTAEELERVQAQQEFELLTGLERLGGFGGKADRLALYNTFLGDPDRIGADYERYLRLDAEDLRAAAARFLGPARLVLAYEPETARAPSLAGPDRSVAPPLAPSPPFEAPTLATRVLGNGLTVHVVRRAEIPKVSAILLVRAGATADPSERPGVAALTAEMLDEGTTSRTALEIERELERLGSRLSTAAQREWSLLSLESLGRHRGASFGLLADVLLHPVFPEEELERVRRQRLDAILQERASASATAGRVLRKAVFGARHPYGWPVGGEEESVRAATRDELEAFYRAHYGPGAAALVLVGDVDPDEAATLAERHLAPWAARPAPPPPVEPVRPDARRIFFVDRPGSAQSEIRIGFVAPERGAPTFPALEVLNTILGGGFSSRLNLNLREDKGYAYGAFSGVRYGRVESLLVASAAVETSVSREAVDEMLAELEGLGRWTRPVADTELADAKTVLARGYAPRFESLAQIAAEVAELEGYGVGVEAIARYPADIEAVGLDDVRRVAAAILDLDRLVLVVVGDAERVLPRLEAAGLGPIRRVDPDGRPVDD